jgi:light-regulated signal transduction histidine kinase (bacteriophytochrome)
MSSVDGSSLKRYTVSFLSVFAASLLTVAVQPLFGGKAPLFFFTVAVIVSAVVGGLGPGLAATGLGVAVVILSFQPQILVLSAAHSSVVLFGLLGVGISGALGYLRRVNAALVMAKASLETANEKLAERTQSLSQSNEELQRFAYALAHDLNTPLRGISALTTLLLERNAQNLDESSQECARMIVGRVERLQAMIKGLLDYAAAVEKPEERVVLDCTALVGRAILDLDDTVRESGAQIVIDPLPSVRATESHLTQVFSNLISNAMKYRPIVRHPQIHISAHLKGDDWAFCVSDNGIGLDMKFAEDIFGMFRRLHGEDQYEGTGIGLALCKIIVERHGGRIWVESEVGKGSRFFFTIPNQKAK